MLQILVGPDMIITCQKCNTKFNLDNALAKPLARAKCSFCGNVFVLADGMDNQAFEQISQNAKTNAESTKETVDAIINDGISFNVDSVKPKKRSKKIPIFLAVLFILLLTAAASFYFKIITFDGIATLTEDKQTTAPEATPAKPQNSEQESSAQNNVQTNSTNATAPAVQENEHLKNIILQGVRQFYVNNEKVGQLFVIEGKVVNNFNTPKELIKIEALLLDAQGQPVVTQEQFCGVVVSMFQLQVLSQPELEKALTNNIDILTNNTNIQPGGAVQFMVVFPNAPSTVREFVLRVIDAKDPPSKN